MSFRKLLSETRRTCPATKVHCQQPSRILIVDVTSPSWTNTCSLLSEALENTLCLAHSLTGPCRVPLLSLYVVQNQQECLLPFTQVKENFARIQACISELRSLPREGCFPQGGNGVVQAVQDGLQQFKQYSRHTAAGSSANNSVEITILTSQSSQEMAKQLEKKLKDVDLVSLRSIQVIEVLKRDFLQPEDVEQHMPAEEPDSNGFQDVLMDNPVRSLYFLLQTPMEHMVLPFCFLLDLLLDCKTFKAQIISLPCLYCSYYSEILIHCKRSYQTINEWYLSYFSLLYIALDYRLLFPKPRRCGDAIPTF